MFKLNSFICITVNKFSGSHVHNRFSSVFLILKTVHIQLTQIKAKIQYLGYESIWYLKRTCHFVTCKIGEEFFILPSLKPV